MRRLTAISGAVGMMGLGLAAGLAPAAADTGTGAATGPITIPASDTSGPASPYPTTITLAGVAGTVESVRVTLDDLTHTFPEDLLVVLQAPNGATTTLLDHCADGSDVVDADITFATGAPAVADFTQPLAPGTYAPTTCFPEASLVAPGPARPYGTGFGALFGGDPNGEWRLWIDDQWGGDQGDLGGWSLEVTTNTPPAGTGSGAISLSTVSGSPLSGDLASHVTDAEGDPITFGLASPPASGTVVVQPGGQFTYTPAAGFVGADSFTFTADDGVVAPVDPPAPDPDPECPPEECQFGSAAVSTLTVSIQVTPVQEPTTTSTTASPTAGATPTTARAVLARTGVDRGTTAAGGGLAIAGGLALVAASGVLAGRARRLATTC